MNNNVTLFPTQKVGKDLIIEALPPGQSCRLQPSFPEQPLEILVTHFHNCWHIVGNCRICNMVGFSAHHCNSSHGKFLKSLGYTLLCLRPLIDKCVKYRQLREIHQQIWVTKGANLSLDSALLNFTWGCRTGSLVAAESARQWDQQLGSSFFHTLQPQIWRWKLLFF